MVTWLTRSSSTLDFLIATLKVCSSDHLHKKCGIWKKRALRSSVFKKLQICPCALRQHKNVMIIACSQQVLEFWCSLICWVCRKQNQQNLSGIIAFMKRRLHSRFNRRLCCLLLRYNTLLLFLPEIVCMWHAYVVL